MYYTFDWREAADNNNKIKEVIIIFKSRLVPETNETFKRYNYLKWNQKQDKRPM
jgi:hypothetical protein